MQVVTEYGQDQITLTIADEDVLAATPPLPPALADPAEAIRLALETPFQFPPLRKALTPDDHITFLVDERLPALESLLPPILQHILSAGVAQEAITLLCPPSHSAQPWFQHLPADLKGVRLEVHDPQEEKQICYLASTKKGRRCYLSRTLIEADQIVALTARRFDPLMGYGGAEAAFFPGLGDAELRGSLPARLHEAPPGEQPWPIQTEVREIGWLLGAPFFIQVIEGPGDSIAHVIAGIADACREGERLLDATWRRFTPARADLVIASLRGNPARHTFADLSAALFAASRVVRSEGSIVLLSQATPHLDESVECLTQAADPRETLRILEKKTSLEQVPAWQWAQTAAHARIYLLSGLEGEDVEELFATPMENARQAQRLIDGAGSCLLLEDAHKTLAEVAD